MRYRIQFLDGSAIVIAEWRIDAQNAGRAIELLEGMRWPAGAVWHPPARLAAVASATGCMGPNAFS
jgi:hypothetical protein